MEKSSLVVLRNGGIVEHSEKWSFRGQSMKVVSCYNYFGRLFSSRLNLSMASKTLAAHAKEALFPIFKALICLFHLTQLGYFLA